MSRCRVLYISPFKALASDVERNLRVPIAGIARLAEKLEMSIVIPIAAIRTGDTSTAERAHLRGIPRIS